MKLSERLAEFALGVATDFKKLGSFAFAKQSAYPVFSMMPDSGRFAGDIDPVSLTFTAPFTPNNFLMGFNGATLANAGKFIHNNTDNGGSSGTLTEPVTALLAAMGRTGDEARYGVEFYIMRATAGAGTDGGTNNGRDGTARNLILANSSQAIYQAEDWATFVGWVRVASGSIHCSAERYENGVQVEFGEPLLPADGWVHTRVIQQSPRGYNYSFPSMYAAPGTVLEIACAGIFNGLVNVGIHNAPIATTGNVSPSSKQDVSIPEPVTATAYTLVRADAGKYKRFLVTANTIVTLPDNATVPYPVGTEITLRMLSAFTLTIAKQNAATGINMNSGGTLALTQGMTVVLKKVDTDNWDLIGQTVAA